VWASSVGVGVMARCPCGVVASTDVAAFRSGAVDFVRCNACGLLRRNNFPSPEALSAIYAEAYRLSNVTAGETNQESGCFALRSYARYLTTRVMRPGDKILDFGAGTGAFVSELSSLGVSSVGAEYSRDARDWCKANRGFALLAPDEVQRVGSFDIITLIEVIEHFSDLRADLSQVYGALGENGLVFITTPNCRGLRARLEGGNWREATKDFHLYLFSDHSLVNALEVAGFVDVRVLRFPPVVVSGAVPLLVQRTLQALGLSGGLVATARRRDKKV
jgi:SAM-dependent methyltransferase